MERRVNDELAKIVLRGVQIEVLSGAIKAWVFMMANNVPQFVILRVLGTPELSRPADLLARSR
jgi:hypothetical protein